MPNERGALGSGPITFSDNDGKHHSIPLTALRFVDGSIEVTGWPGSTYDVTSFLKRLVDAQAIKLEPPPAAKPAIKATAITPGFSHVRIVIDVSKVTVDNQTPADSKVTVTVTETDTYTNLTAAQLKPTLGEKAFGGSRPGLVFVSSADNPNLPQEGTYKLAAPQGSNTKSVNILYKQQTAFSLTARTANDRGDSFTAVVKDIVENADPTKSTFTLIIEWTKKVNDIKIGDLKTEFSFVVNIEPPADGYQAPAKDKVVLVGGTDAVTATPSSVVILTSP